MALERLVWDVEVHVRDAIINTYNALEDCAACAGIKDDPDNALKAITNHYGHPTKGRWAPPRVYITNATTDGEQGRHKSMPNADLALKRVIMDTFRRSVVRAQRNEDLGMSRTSRGSNLAFGSTNSIRRVLLPIAEQMHENQMMALDNVLPKNTKSTLERKKKRSDKALINYGKMKAASKFWVDIGGDEDAE